MRPSFLAHLRPQAWPLLSAHLFMGTLLAKGWPPSRSSLVAWLIAVVLLGGGAFALEGAYGPPEAEDEPQRRSPPFLTPLGFTLLGGSLLWSVAFIPLRPGGRYFFEIVMTCVLISVLHSVPPIRLRARPGWDLLLQGLGFGFFAPMAGWCATGRGLEPRLVDLCVGGFFLFAALYPLTRIPRREGPPRPAEPSLISRLGVATSLTYALGAALVAHLWFAQALLKAHAPVAPLLVSLLAWLGVLLPWRARWSQWTPAQAKAGLYRGLVAWAITDLSLLVLLWPN